MIVEQHCEYCRNSYEVSWDEEPDAYVLGVEDTDRDHTDMDSDELPVYCPFCGTHETYEDES